MNYRSDIDGLRALAIIPVVLFHAGVKAFPGGYVGVDIFFVISGYVIALSLLEDLHRGEFSILKFYAKRIRRIFPALFLTIGVTSVFSWLLLLPSHLDAYFESLVNTVLFLSNIFFWRTSGYFASAALTQPLLHTWSLSVEEQYYLFIPTLMFVVYTYASRRWALVFLPAILASLALSVYATSTAPTANFFLLPTRAWELLVGAFLAAVDLPPLRSRLLREAAGMLGLLLILYPVLAFDQYTAFPGVNALYPCLGSALIIYLGIASRSFANSLLSLRPFVGIGLISYSLYLVHWPIAAFTYYLTAAAPTLAVSAGIVASSLVLAWFSWRFVEQPFRKISVGANRSRWLWGGMAMIGLFACGGGLALQAHGFPSRFPDFAEQVIPGHQLWNSGTCFLPNDPDPALWNIDICRITHGGKHRVLLWGDSFAAQYVPGIVANQGNLDAVFFEYTSAGCPPVLSYYSYARPRCTEFNRNALRIIRDARIDAVILSARWTELKERGIGQLASTLAELKPLGVEVYVIGQSPEFAADVQILSYHRLGDRPDGSKAWPLSFNRAINEEIARDAPSVHFIDPLQYLCGPDACNYFAHGAYLFEDYGHLSQTGSEMAVRAFFPFNRKSQVK